MISFVIASHGPLAGALICSVEMVVGRRPELYAAEIMPEDSLDGYKRRLAELLDRLLAQGEVVLLSDFPLGTPFNAALSLRQGRFRHLTGANAPMLFALLDPANQALGLDGLCQAAVRQARKKTLFVNKLGEEGAC